jgi:pyruvate-ferredoxin/flavodoxin oxidoreductase
VSHLRFGPRPIESTYLIDRAQFIACHNWELLHRIDVLQHAAKHATVLLDVRCEPSDVWKHLPARVRNQIVDRDLTVYAINASAVAAACGTGRHVNTILQTCFFAIAKVMPVDEAASAIKDAIRKSYASKGDVVVKRNLDAVDQALAHLHEIEVPHEFAIESEGADGALAFAPPFVRETIAAMLGGNGDAIPVSLVPADGTYPTGTSRWEKRNLADEIPVWDERICIQCGKCAFVCPHAAIRIKAYEPKWLEDAPPTLKSTDYRGTEYTGMKYTIQVAPEDCTGCRLCVDVCPARDKATGTLALEMHVQPPLREAERTNYEFFLNLP